MRRPRRRTALLGAGVLVLVAAVVAAVLLLRGPGPEEVAEDYLAALWSGEAETRCELATEEWRRFLYEGYPFGSCQQFADAADDAAERDEADGVVVVETEADVRITVVELSKGDGRARVSYLVEFVREGGTGAGSEGLGTDGAGVDRGTIELAEVDGDWRVAGVDAG